MPTSNPPARLMMTAANIGAVAFKMAEVPAERYSVAQVNSRNGKDAERPPVPGEFAALTPCQEHRQQHQRGDHDAHLHQREGAKFRASNPHEQE
jgi:hypothetical protein